MHFDLVVRYEPQAEKDQGVRYAILNDCYTCKAVVNFHCDDARVYGTKNGISISGFSEKASKNAHAVASYFSIKEDMVFDFYQTSKQAEPFHAFNVKVASPLGTDSYLPLALVKVRVYKPKECFSGDVATLHAGTYDIYQIQDEVTIPLYRNHNDLYIQTYAKQNS